MRAEKAGIGAKVANLKEFRGFLIMPRAGIEPARDCSRGILSPGRAHFQTDLQPVSAQFLLKKPDGEIITKKSRVRKLHPAFSISGGHGRAMEYLDL